jgi:hypothetical protein
MSISLDSTREVIYTGIESSSIVNLSDPRLLILCDFHQNLDIVNAEVIPG